MTTVTGFERLALSRPETHGAILAVRLTESLAAALRDEKGGAIEALAREVALDQDSTEVMSLEQLDQWVARRRR